MIITGAPVENLDFTDVDYWDELCQIMDWTTTHVHSTLHICWGSSGNLFHHYGIPKYTLDKSSLACSPHGGPHPVPSSGALTMCSTSLTHATPKTGWRTSSAFPSWSCWPSQQAGVFAVKSADNRRFFITGHPEYDPETLANEYFRDVNKGIDINVPDNYFPNNDPTQPPGPLALRRPAVLYQLAELLCVPDHPLRCQGHLSFTPRSTASQPSSPRPGGHLWSAGFSGGTSSGQPHRGTGDGPRPGGPALSPGGVPGRAAEPFGHLWRPGIQRFLLEQEGVPFYLMAASICPAVFWTAGQGKKGVSNMNVTFEDRQKIPRDPHLYHPGRRVSHRPGLYRSTSSPM